MHFSWRGSHRPQGSLQTGRWSAANVLKNSMQTHAPGRGVTSGVRREPAVPRVLVTCCPESVAPCPAAHGSVPWRCRPCRCPKEPLQPRRETSRSFAEVRTVVSHRSSTIQAAVVSSSWSSALAARSSADPPSPGLSAVPLWSVRLRSPTGSTFPLQRSIHVTPLNDSG